MVIIGKNQPVLDQAWRRTLEAWESYEKTNKRDSMSTNKQGHIKWTAHPQQVLKANVDVVPFKLGRVITVIIRDFIVSVVAVGVNKVPFISNPMILEAKVMMDELNLATSCNFQKVQIERDAKIILDVISKDNLDPSYLQMLIKYIRDMSR